MKKLIFIILFAGFLVHFDCNLVNAQGNDPQIDELKKKFDNSDQREYDKAIEKYKLGQTMRADADKLFEQAKQKMADADNASEKLKKKYKKEAEKIEKKAIAKRVKASATLAESNKIVYNIYKKYLKKIGSNAAEIKRNQVKAFEKDADDYYLQAKGKREKANSTKMDIAEAYKFSLAADEAEANAIAVQIQAFGIYLDWYTVDDKSIKSNDATNNTNYGGVTTTDNSVANPYLIADNYQSPKDSVPDNANSNKNFEVYKGGDANNSSISNAKKGLIFKVQIAASPVPLSIEKLRQIYPSNEILNNEMEDNLYKYSVGRFATYEQAYAYKLRMGVKGAFVIAYRDGVKIKDITEVAQPIDPNNFNAKAYQKSNDPTNDDELLLEYRVQIGTTKNPATDYELKQMNSTQMPVKVYLSDDGWYKYTIGSFPSEASAKRYVSDNNMPANKAYVVKYRNGMEVK